MNIQSTAACLCGQGLFSLRSCLRIVIVSVAAAGILPASSGPIPTATQSNEVHFETDVKPILNANCLPCHGSEAKMKGLDLTTLAGVMDGSESGPVVTPGKADDSLLFQVLHDGSMPKNADPLSSDQIAVMSAASLSEP